MKVIRTKCGRKHFHCHLMLYIADYIDLLFSFALLHKDTLEGFLGVIGALV